MACTCLLPFVLVVSRRAIRPAPNATRSSLRFSTFRTNFIRSRYIYIKYAPINDINLSKLFFAQTFLFALGDTSEFLYTKRIYPRFKEKRRIKRSDLIRVQPCVEKIRFIRTKISARNLSIIRGIIARTYIRIYVSIYKENIIGRKDFAIRYSYGA